MKNKVFKILLLVIMLLLHMFFSNISELNKPLHLTYKIYDKKVEYLNNEHNNAFYYLYCYESDYGNFKIDVDENTFRNKKVNDYIKFQNGLSRNEMLKASIYKSTKTREKIAKNVNNTFCKKYITDDFFRASIYTSVLILILCFISLFIFIIINDFLIK